MPPLKNCRLDFLQGVLKGTKTALKATEVPARKARGRSASVAAEQIAPPPRRTAVSVGSGRARSKDKGLVDDIAADLPKPRNRAGMTRTRAR